MPDANARLAQLIGSMVRPDGKVVVPGFYSDVPPLSLGEKAMLASVPEDTRKMQATFGIGSPDKVAPTFQEALNLPTFTVQKMSGGEAGSVIPSSANAKIVMILVKENDPQTMLDRLAAHIRDQGYFIVGKDPDISTLASHAHVAKFVGIIPPEGSGAWRTDPESREAKFATDAIRKLWGKDIVQIRTLGGGVPASFFIDAFHVPTVGISIAIANYDDNQHSDNENIRVGNILDGIVTIAGLLTN